MGIRGLWDLTSPGARRVPITVLEGRSVAVDASIWLAQFNKAIRDASGEPFQGAHVLGFFRRLCKLYFYKMKPVIVFDGPPPPLKQRTLRERRRRREEEKEELQRTAERLMANIVKRKKLGMESGSDARYTLRDILAGNVEPEREEALESLRLLLPAKERDIVVSESSSDDEVATPSNAHATAQSDEDQDDPLSLQSERRQRRIQYYESIPEDFRGFLEKRRRLDELSVPQDTRALLQAPRVHNQEKNYVRVIRSLDEFKEFHLGGEGGDVVRIPLDCEIDEEVFRALPHKLQFKVLVQLRDQWTAENRLRAIASSHDATAFSQIQMESYLRTIHTNQEIEKTKKELGLQLLQQAQTDPLNNASSSSDSDDDDAGFMKFFDDPSATVTGENLESQLLQQLADEEATQAEQREKVMKSVLQGKKKTKAQEFLHTEAAPVDLRMLDRAKHWFHGSPQITRNAFVANNKPALEPLPARREPIDGSPIVVSEVDWEDDIIDLNNIPLEPTPDEEMPKAAAEPMLPRATKRVEMKRKGQNRVDLSGGWKIVEDDEEGWDAWEDDAPQLSVKSEADLRLETLQCLSKAELAAEGVKEAKTDEVIETKIETTSPSAAVALFSENEPTPDTSSAAPERPEAAVTSDRVTGEHEAPVPLEERKEAAVPPVPSTVVTDLLETGEETVKSSASSSPAGSSTAAPAAPAAPQRPVGTEFLTVSERTFEKRLGGDTDDAREMLEEGAKDILRSLRKGQQRTAEVTQEMYEDIRKLLRYFGIPYVNAPSEAEAQAATLCQLGLVELVISDDSDTLAFECSEVIRHMFASDNSVELFCQRDILRKLGLTVEDMRCVALLTGCDYTVGVKGIGIVNALEVIQAFGNTVTDLKRFATWAKDLMHVTSPGVVDTDSPEVKVYKKKHFNYRPYWYFPSDFPSEEVMRAFSHPRVDRSTEAFHWVAPEFDELAAFVVSKTGVADDKIRDMLVPVMARMREPHPRKQALLDMFILPPSEEEQVAEYRSARLKNAIDFINRKKGG